MNKNKRKSNKSNKSNLIKWHYYKHKSIITIAILVSIFCIYKGLVVAYNVLFPVKDINNVIPISKDNINLSVKAIGDIQYSKLYKVGFEISGKVDKIYITEGDNVKKDQIIVKISNDTFLHDYDIYKNYYDLAKYKYLAYSNLSKDDLSKVISKLEFKKIFKEYKNAELELKKKEYLVSKLKIKATESGSVVAVLVEEGQILNTNFSDAQNVAFIANDNNKKGVIEVSEYDINKIKINDIVEYGKLNQKEQLYCKSKVTFIDSISVKERANLSADTPIYYYVKFPILNDCKNNFKSGMKIQANIIYSNKQAILIPNDYIYYKDNLSIYSKKYDIINNKIIEQNIIIGDTDGQNTQIIQGLNENNYVIK